MRLADKLGIDLIAAAHEKIEVNAQRYPASTVRGSSKKYTGIERPRPGSLAAAEKRMPRLCKKNPRSRRRFRLRCNMSVILVSLSIHLAKTFTRRLQ